MKEKGDDNLNISFNSDKNSMLLYMIHVGIKYVAQNQHIHQLICKKCQSLTVLTAVKLSYHSGRFNMD